MRFGVFDSENVRVAAMTLDIVAGRLEGSGQIDLREMVDTALADFKPNNAVDIERELLTRLGQGVAPQGLTVRRIADVDLVFKAELDSRLGTVVGRSEVAEGATDLPADMLRGIAASIAGVTTRFAEDLADRIDGLGAADAVAAVRAAHASGQLNFEPTNRLADLLASIDVDGLAEDAAKAFLPLRLMIATRLDRYDVGAADAAALLARWPEHRPELADEYQNIIAIDHAKSGRTDTAISIWERLVAKPDLAAGQRGQFYRNLAFAVQPSDARALRWIELSADAYLQAGDRREAATSHVFWGDILEHHDARLAVRMLDGADTLLDGGGLIGDALRAALLYARARRLVALNRDDDALAAALESVEIRRTLTGQETELLASLALAEKAAGKLGDPCAGELARESSALLAEVPVARFVLGAKITGLLAHWDASTAVELRTALAGTDDLALHIAAETVLLGDPDLDAEAALAGLEALHVRALAQGASGEQLIPIRLSLFKLLYEQGANARAIPWLERILVDVPLAEGVVDQLIAAHWRAGNWKAGAIAIRREISLKGEDFPWLMALSAFARRAGEADEALRAALAGKLLAIDAEQVAEAEKLMLEASQDGAHVAVAVAEPAVSPVTASMFEEALRDFAINTARNARMRYWEKLKDAKDYSWIPNPERRAQDDLRLWFEARFGGRVTVLEEVGTGAGRLDLLVQLAGGTQVIVELKMLGFGYASTYAAAGADQVLHYMENRGLRLGYLVAFDGRLTNNGDVLLASILEPGMTVREILVDVSPRVAKRMRKA